MIDGNTTAERMHARKEGEQFIPEFSPTERITDQDLFGDVLHDCEDIYWLTPLAECFGKPLDDAIQALGVLEDLTRVTGNVAHVQAVIALRALLHKISKLEREAIAQADECNGE